jgi:hypothetical protein
MFASFLALTWKTGLTMILKKNYKPINQSVSFSQAISKKGRLGIGQSHNDIGALEGCERESLPNYQRRNNRGKVGEIG